jgi:predicted ATPase
MSLLNEQLALYTLSLFGASVKIEYLELLESQLGLKLLEPLARAAAEGLVINQAGGFHFCHDRIQEASYKLIAGHARQSNHLMYGRCLVRHAAEIGNDDMLFTAVNQFNLAGRAAISNADECYTMANYNLIAGKKAMASSAFSVAYSLLDHGIGFLGNDHWQTHYKLSLTLYELACQSALAVADINGLNCLREEVMKHAKCPEDKVNIQFIHLSPLVSSLNGIVALESGLAVVSNLGVDIPSNPSQELIQQNIQYTQSMLAVLSENEILNYRMMTNTRTIAVMKFLARLQAIVFFVKPALQSIMILKMVQITISEGKAVFYLKHSNACFDCSP